MKQQGFTLIELVVVIVILGILAVTAAPKFIDLSTEAETASADGVYGAASSATALNHAAKLVGQTTTLITTGTTLLGAMEGTPDGWALDDAGANLGICTDDGAGVGDCAGASYIITITQIETAGTSGVKALLSKSW